jgi:Na+-driven multidrug efflux pump
MSHRASLLRLALPNYVALLSSVVAGIIDVAWVARLGAEPVAAVAVATGVENALLGVVLLINGGVTVVLAGRLGAGDAAAARTTVRAGWRLYAVITPAVVLAGFALRRPLAEGFLDDEAAAGLAADYFAVLFPAVAIFFAQQVVDAIFTGHGDTRTPMRLALTSNAILLVLDPLLIYGPGPFPALGVVGAAVATAAGRAVALAVGLVLVRRLISRAAEGREAGVPRAAGAGAERAVGETRAAGAGAERAVGETRAAVWVVARTGAPIAGDFLVRMAGALVIIAVVGRFGVAAVAGYGIGMKVLYFATMGFYAIRNAATVHTPRTLSALPSQERDGASGEPDGASGERDRASENRDGERAAIGRHVLALALAAGVLATVLFAAAAPVLMRLFTGEPEVIGTGVTFLRSIGGYLASLAAVVALGGFLVGSGRGPRLFGITVIGTAVQTALAWWWSAVLGLSGVWWAMTAAAVVQLVLVLRLARLRTDSGTTTPDPVAIGR